MVVDLAALPVEVQDAEASVAYVALLGSRLLIPRHGCLEIHTDAISEAVQLAQVPHRVANAVLGCLLRHIDETKSCRNQFRAISRK